MHSHESADGHTVSDGLVNRFATWLLNNVDKLLKK